MHSDPAELKKSIRTYGMVGGLLFVFTAITVGVNEIHLSSVALAITIALLIATFKGSMVASIFMHLKNEKKWIYGSLLLTVVFFFFVLLLPMLAMSDHIGTEKPFASVPAGAAEHAEGGH